MSVNRRWFAVTLRFGLLLLLALCSLPSWAATYVYDANGRLRAITSSSGATSTYNYDKLGNLTSVNSVAAGQLALFAFTPNHGPVGATVILYGQGFSTTPSSNVVKFNGVVATVAAGATTTKLTVTVPSGATTGTVSITVGSSSATSADVFTVTTDSGGSAPTVASFTPGLANPGTSISVTGNQFVTTAGATLAGVNEAVSTVTPASNTQLSFAVPAQTGSGPVNVVTPYGSGESATALIVLPASIPVSTIAASAVLTVGGSPQSLNVATAGDSAVAIFQGGVGQWISLQCSSFTSSPTQSVNVSLWSPNGTDLFNGALSTNALTLHLPELPTIGTYTLTFTPASGGTAQVSVALEQNATVTSAGTTTIATSVPGQSKRVIFSDIIGQYEGLDTVSSSVSPSTAIIVEDAWGPMGEKWTPSPAQPVSPFLNFPQATESGIGYATYGTDIGATFSLGLTLNTNPTTALTLNASALAQSIPYAYENGYYTFSGTSGQNVSIAFGTITPTTGGYLYFNVLAPDGTLYGYDYTGGTSVHLGLHNLTQTGTYQIVPNNQIGPTTFGVNVSTDASGSLTVNTPKTVSLTKPGQVGRYTFSGTAGKYYGLQLAVQSTSPAGDTLYLNVYDPTGAAVYNGNLQTTSTGFLNLQALSTTGTYTVEIDGTGANTSSSQLTLFANPTGNLTVGGSPASLAGTAPGENLYLYMAGTAGQNISFAFTSISTTPSGGYVYANIVDPQGNYFGAIDCYTPCHQAFSNLPYTGNYLFEMLPSGGSQSVTLSTTSSASADVTGTLVLNTPQTINLTQPGQVGLFNFSGSAGQFLGINETLISTSPSGGTLTFTVLNPDGTALPYGSNTATSQGFANLFFLSQTGTYKIKIESSGVDTSSVQLQLVTEPSLALTINGSAQPLATIYAGQYAFATFTGSTGQALTLHFTGLSTSPSGGTVSVSGHEPDSDNDLFFASYCSSTSCDLPLSALPLNGTYTFIFYVDANSTETFNVSLSSP